MYGRRTLYLPRLSRGGDAACGRVSASRRGVRASYRCGAFSAKKLQRRVCLYRMQDYYPETLEEQLICYADKFYSKSHPDGEKTPEQALKSVSKYGEDGARRFRHWMELLRKISGIKRILCNFASAYWFRTRLNSVENKKIAIFLLVGSSFCMLAQGGLNEGLSSSYVEIGRGMSDSLVKNSGTADSFY